MSSSISDLSPDMIYYQLELDELIKEKDAKLKKFKVHQEYFEADDKLRNFMENQKIDKRIAIAKIPLEFALNLPSRNFEKNEKYNLDIFEYINPLTKESKIVTLTHTKKEEDKEDKDEEEEEDKDEEDKEKKDNKRKYNSSN